MTLTDFLLARITEDEEAAKGCAVVYPSPWEVVDRGHSAKIDSDEPHFLTVAALDQEHAEGAEWVGDRLAHIARHDPGRVLAECEAKRWIVVIESSERAKRDAPEHRRAWEDERVTISFWESGMLRTLTDEARDAFIAEWYEPSPPSRVLRALALPYADHPDYREEWRA